MIDCSFFLWQLMATAHKLDCEFHYKPLLGDSGSLAFRFAHVHTVCFKLNPCQITSFYILMVLLKWLMQYPKKLMVRLHHAHPSNAAPAGQFSWSTKPKCMVTF